MKLEKQIKIDGIIEPVAIKSNTYDKHFLKYNEVKDRVKRICSEHDELIEKFNKVSIKTDSDFDDLKIVSSRLKRIIKNFYYDCAILLKMQIKIIKKIADNQEKIDNLYNFITKFEVAKRKNNVYFTNNFAWKLSLLKSQHINLILKAKFYEYKLTKKELANYSKKILSKAETNKVELSKNLNIIKSICETNFNMLNSRLVTKLDKITHKKNEKFSDIESDSVISLKQVAKYYCNKFMAVKVLNDIDLEIKKGEFVVILGPSGSGKTTLLNIISGMDIATKGETYVCNKNLMYLDQNDLTYFRKQNIGYIFQQYGLLPNLTVRENVEIGWNLQDDKQKRMDINELLMAVGMCEYKNKRPHELSGGQQQRVSIARSLAKNPEIIFGDEPTGAIDESMSKQIMELFLDINKKYKTTIIIVTHNPAFALLAQRVIKVNNGKISSNEINKDIKKIDELPWSE